MNMYKILLRYKKRKIVAVSFNSCSEYSKFCDEDYVDVISLSVPTERNDVYEMVS